MEVKKKKAIVLTPEGQFLEHPYQGPPPELGAEIELGEQRNWDYWGLIRIAALLVIIVIPFLTLQPLFTPDIFAYVTVDINPSIELAIDKNEKVLSVTSLNNEGEKLITKVNIKNIPLTEAIELITEAAIQEKYIAADRDNTVFISYSQVDQNKKTTQDQEKEINTNNEAKQIKRTQLEGKVQEVVNRNQQQASVEFVQVSFELRDQAKEMGLSSGKFALVLEAQDIGIEINVDSIKEKGIVHAIKEAGGNPGQIIKHLHNKNSNYIASDVQNNTNQVEDIIDKLEQEGNINIGLEEKDISKESTLTQEDIQKINEIKEASLDGLSFEDQKKLDKRLLEKFKETAPQQILDKLRENLSKEAKDKDPHDVLEEEEPKKPDKEKKDPAEENTENNEGKEVEETEVEDEEQEENVDTESNENNENNDRG